MGQNKNEYDREYYRLNREKRKEQIRQRNLIAIARNRQNLIEFLTNQSCVDCGFNDIRALQFDHRNPDQKRGEISNMVSTAYSWDTILDEISKCDIVCANCHSIRTSETYGFYKSAGLA